VISISRSATEEYEEEENIGQFYGATHRISAKSFIIYTEKTILLKYLKI